MKKNERFEVRLSGELLASAKEAAQSRGFTSLNSFIRTALQNEVRQGETALDKAERMIAASMDRLARDVRTIHTAQQAVFALTDSLARLFLTCVPEPPPEVLDQARRKAKLRYDRFLRSVAQNMTVDSQAAVSELVDRG